jgi:hypothetical protein
VDAVRDCLEDIACGEPPWLIRAEQLRDQLQAWQRTIVLEHTSDQQWR